MSKNHIEQKDPQILMDLHLSNIQLGEKYNITQNTVRALRKRIATGVSSIRPSEITDDPSAVILLIRLRDADESGGYGLTVDVLSSYDGTRVFHQDYLDPRVTMAGEIPHFQKWHDALAYMVDDIGSRKPCTVGLVSAAKHISGPWADFRPDVEELMARTVHATV